MNKVHTRSFEKIIVVNINEDFQPIFDNDKVLSEFGQFSRTQKKCVPLTYKSWKGVPENFNTALLNFVKVTSKLQFFSILLLTLKILII